MTQVLIDRELLERLLYSNSPARFDATEYNAARAELFAILANPTQQGEAVEVRGLQWLDTGHYRKKPPQFGYNPHDWNPLMTVAQHQRILAASVPAGCKVVPVEFLERVLYLMDNYVTHETPEEEELRALLNGGEA